MYLGKEENMKQEGRGKGITVFFLAVLMMISAVFFTEVPVNAASISKSTVTASIHSIGRYTIRVQWKKCSLADGYRIYRKTANGKYYAIKDVSKNTTSYLDKNLTSATQYQYAVRAFRKEGNSRVLSAYQSVITATKPEETTITAKADSYSQVTVSWKKVARADGYRIYRKEGAQKNWSFLADVSGSKTSYQDKKVSQNTKYVYTVRAYKKVGKIKLQADYMKGKQYIQSNTVQTPMKETISKNKITAKVVSRGSYSIKISWDKSRLAEGYYIYRKQVGKGNYKIIKTVGSNVTSYTDKNLTSATEYQYAVRGFRKETNGVRVQSAYQATAVCVTYPDRFKLNSLKAKADTSTQVTVSWYKIPRADGYIVYRKSVGQGWKRVTDVAASKTSYTDKTASPNTKYVYTVRAYKTCGNIKWQADYTESGKTIQTSSVTTPEKENTAKFNTYQKDVVKKILYAVESGGQVYGNQDYSNFTEAYANSSAEHAITIGAGQWYANEARRLLHLIHDTMSAKEYAVYDPKNLVWNDVKYKTEGGPLSWSSYRISKNSEKGKIMVKLISSKVGIKCQDQLMYEQIEDYENQIRKLGVTEIKSVAMLINVLHQGGYSAVVRILNKTEKPVTLDHIYAALNTDTGKHQVGAYKERQKRVYNWLKTYMK